MYLDFVFSGVKKVKLSNAVQRADLGHYGVYFVAAKAIDGNTCMSPKVINYTYFMFDNQVTV